MSLSNKSKIDAFVQAAKDIPHFANNPPKFQVGDYIISTKFKVISKVIEITGIFEDEERKLHYETAMYILEDVKNLAREKYMAGANILTTQDSRGFRQNKHKRHKYVQAIDAYYKLINPDAAQALYGVKVSSEVNDGNG